MRLILIIKIIAPKNKVTQSENNNNKIDYTRK